MKLWEVLKTLDDNPNKRFKCSLIGGYKGYIYTEDNYYRLDIHSDDGLLILQEKKGGAFNESIRVNKDWQEVKQPVTWQEAIEAWVNGKTIRCEDGGSDYLFSGGRNALTDSVGPIDKYQITKGTWYIED